MGGILCGEQLMSDSKTRSGEGNSHIKEVEETGPNSLEPGAATLSSLSTHKVGGGKDRNCLLLSFYNSQQLHSRLVSAEKSRGVMTPRRKT